MSRTVHDSLGEIQVPDGVLWGASTARALQNFPISGYAINQHPHLLRALAMVKSAAASANEQLGLLEPFIADAIRTAAAEVMAGRWHEEFPVDVMQGGAGTSTNMNMNEVLAARAELLLPGGEGSTLVHPNDHVNKSQSTNDAYPTAVRVALLLGQADLGARLETLAMSFERKAVEFADVVKLGRTEMQDAVPMTLGQEFGAFAATLREDIMRLGEASKLLCEVNLGGTAIGTRINADPAYGPLAIGALSHLCGFDLVQSANLIEASWDMGGFVMFSAVLKRIATKLSKIANDLRLLSSGPRGGFGEINLPALQPGSSIMPGKVNPVIPEMVSMVAYQVIGLDLASTMAAEAGQLQLNAFEPLIAHNTLSAVKLISNAVGVFATLCVDGISANRDNCLRHLEASTATVTALVPVIGYEKAVRLAKAALASGRSIRDLAHEALPGVDVNKLLDTHLLAGG